VRALAAVLLGGVLLAASAAAAPTPGNKARLDRTVRYLQAVQRMDGGFGQAGEPSQISSAWAALALAAAGINPQDQARRGGLDAYGFLAGHFRQGVGEELCAPAVCTTAYERELMVVNTAGTSPHDFGGVDLAGELLGRANDDGSFGFVPGGEGTVNATAFAIFALAPIHEPEAQAPIQAAADWLGANQQDNGGWAWDDRDAPDEVDLTGAVLQALIAAGRSESPAVQEGVEYLRRAQNPDGGFPEFPGEHESNAASTAWATQAIWAVGENPEGWLTGSGQETEEPLDFMESLQAPDGHIAWKKGADTNGVWMTAYVTPAFAGQAWPIPFAPRKSPGAPPEPGEGGDQSGAGVIAGGGGNGAPLFSRPKPQSKGKTPGGARVIRSRGVRATNQSETRRGDNTQQPTATQYSEAAAAPGHPGGSTAALSSPLGSSAGPESGSAGSPLPEALAASRRGSRPGGEGTNVTGRLIGAARHGELTFGAPGLHGAGVSDDEERAVAIGIGAAALLLALCGAQWERRRQEAIL
jgi:squalene-hopene cyclase-like protein/prenyltransferase/squalene oxidase-like repeat protein